MRSILPPGARTAAPAFPPEGADAVVELAFGAFGVDGGGDGFGDAALEAFGTGRPGLGGTSTGGCLGGGLTLLCFSFCLTP